MIAAHGTRSAYMRHLRHHEAPCEPCKRANTGRMASLKGREPREHGTVSAYSNYGCRCDPCKAAGSAANAKTRRKVNAGEYLIRHGSPRRYLQGCRCTDCVEAYTARTEQNTALAKAENDNSRIVASRNGYRRFGKWRGGWAEPWLQSQPSGFSCERIDDINR